LIAEHDAVDVELLHYELKAGGLIYASEVVQNEQDQVNNILKHAKATSASITLNKVDNEVILLISDNGEGTDILKKIDGAGIRNIKSRADLHNGMVTIVSKPGKGYELKVALALSTVE
jgi:signal transduction histidine kinase